MQNLSLAQLTYAYDCLRLGTSKRRTEEHQMSNFNTLADRFSAAKAVADAANAAVDALKKEFKLL